jgi:uncharacterized small protein (DUF1192 family)
MFDNFFEAKVVGADEVAIRLQSMPDAMRAVMQATIERLTAELLVRAQAKAAGGELHERTGRYLASIHDFVEIVRGSQPGAFGFSVAQENSAEAVVGKVYSTDRRAHLFELGYTIPPHDIWPANAHALMLTLPGGGDLFAAVVHHPGVQVKPHAVIHDALHKMTGEIEQALDAAAGPLLR